MKRLTLNIESILKKNHPNSSFSRYCVYDNGSDNVSFFHTDSKHALHIFLELNGLELDFSKIRKCRFHNDIWASIDLRVKEDGKNV